MYFVDSVQSTVAMTAAKHTKYGFPISPTNQAGNGLFWIYPSFNPSQKMAIPTKFLFSFPIPVNFITENSNRPQPLPPSSSLLLHKKTL